MAKVVDPEFKEVYVFASGVDSSREYDSYDEAVEAGKRYIAMNPRRKSFHIRRVYTLV
jgi:hypothetical protein